MSNDFVVEMTAWERTDRFPFWHQFSDARAVDAIAIHSPAFDAILARLTADPKAECVFHGDGLTIVYRRAA